MIKIKGKPGKKEENGLSNNENQAVVPFYKSIGKRCGEILIDRGNFTFLCSSCVEIFESIEAFQDHYNNVHLNRRVEKENEYNVEIRIEKQENNVEQRKSKKNRPSSSYNSSESNTDDNEKMSESSDDEIMSVDVVDSVMKRSNKVDVLKKKPREKKQLQTNPTKKSLATNGGHQCSLCPLKFTKKISLTAHMKRHANQKKFKCNNCDSCFNNKKLLTNHQVVHKNLTAQNIELKESMQTHMKRRSGSILHCALNPDRKYLYNKNLLSTNPIQKTLRREKDKESVRRHMKRHSGSNLNIV